MPIVEVQGRPPAGRPFLPVLERTLERPLRSLAERLPGASEDLILASEFVGPVGVVDLLAVTRATASLDQRIETGPPFLRSVHDAALVAATFEQVTRTKDALAYELGSSPTQLSRRLRRLVADGFLTHYGGGYRRCAGLGIAGRAYALEAKVSDWRRGLAQAMKYASWCDAAGVVLLRPPTNIALVRAHFQSLGLGLALQDRWLVRPRLGRPSRARRLLLSESLAEAYYRIGRDPSSAA